MNNEITQKANINCKKIRTCICCRVKMQKSDFIRIVHSKDGLIKIDFTGKADGRGAYVCSSVKCVDLAFKSNKLGRALRCKVIPIDLKSELEEIGRSSI